MTDGKQEILDLVKKYDLDYVLDDDHNPVAIDTTDDDGLFKWAAWMGDIKKRRVAYTTLPDRGYVSTIFLGINYNFSLQGPPIVFETMVFDDGPFNGEQERYTTWADAEEGHERMVAKVMAGYPWQCPQCGEESQEPELHRCKEEERND